MCGVAGVLLPAGAAPVDLSVVNRLQGHRGPDGHGCQTYVAGAWQLGFSHQRLAIIDLSDAALQPMHDNDGSAIVFNGEIDQTENLSSSSIDGRSLTGQVFAVALYCSGA